MRYLTAALNMQILRARRLYASASLMCVRLRACARARMPSLSALLARTHTRLLDAVAVDAANAPPNANPAFGSENAGMLTTLSLRAHVGST